jgi:hypothetical protein
MKPQLFIHTSLKVHHVSPNLRITQLPSTHFKHLPVENLEVTELMLSALGMRDGVAKCSLFGPSSLSATSEVLNVLAMLQGVLGMAVLSPAGIVSTVVTTDFRRGGGGVGRSATAIGHALEQLGG